MYVPGAAERVAAAYTWTHQLLQERLTAGGLAVAPPVLANLYRHARHLHGISPVHQLAAATACLDLGHQWDASHFNASLFLLFQLVNPLLRLSPAAANHTCYLGCTGTVRTKAAMFAGL